MDKLTGYSNSVILKPVGLVSIELGFLIMGIFLIVFSIVVCKMILREIDLPPFLTIPLAILAFSAINLVSLVLISMPWITTTNEERDRYEQASTEWRVDYVVPYLENNQKTATDIQSIRYNSEIEEKRKTEMYLERKYNTPVRIELSSGKTIEGWAMVEKTNGQEESVTYSELEGTLRFGKARKTVYPNFLNLSEEQLQDNFFINVRRYEIEEGPYLIKVKTDREFLTES